MITSEQIRAARALLRLEQKDLAELSGVSLPTIKRLETQRGVLSAQPRTAEALKSALESQGIQFLESGGVATGQGVAIIGEK